MKVFFRAYNLINDKITRSFIMYIDVFIHQYINLVESGWMALKSSERGSSRISNTKSVKRSTSKRTAPDLNIQKKPIDWACIINSWRQSDLVTHTIQSLQRSFNVLDDATRMCGEILINKYINKQNETSRYFILC